MTDKQSLIGKHFSLPSSFRGKLVVVGVMVVCYASVSFSLLNFHSLHPIPLLGLTTFTICGTGLLLGRASGVSMGVVTFVIITVLLFIDKELAKDVSPGDPSRIFGLTAQLLLGYMSGYLHDLRIGYSLVSAKQQRAEQVVSQWEDVFQWLDLGVAVSGGNESLIKESNPAFAKMLGYSAEELFEKPLVAVFAPEERAKLTDEIHTTAMQGNQTFESTLVCRDSKRLVVLVHITTITNSENHLLHQVASFIDISARKETEETLRKSERMLRLIADNIPAILSYVDSEQRYRFVNSRYQDWCGISPGQIVGRQIKDVLGVENYTAIQSTMERALAGEEIQYEGEFMSPDNNVRWVSATYVPDIGDDGLTKGFFLLGRDITERRRVEEEILKREKLYRGAIAAANAVAYQLDFASNTYTHIDEGIERLIGYTVAESTPAIWSQIAQHSIMYGEAEGLTESEADLRLRSGELKVWKADYQCRAKNGEIRWLSDSSVPIFDALGNVQGCLGILQDTTERKQAERKLRESEEKMRIVFDNVPEFILQVDRKGVISFINRTLPDVILSEIVGKDFFRFLPPEAVGMAKEILEKVFLTGKTHSFELPGKGPEGSTSWYEGHLAPIRQDGKVISAIGVAKDVTEQKSVAEQIRQHQAELAHVSRLATMGEMVTGLAHELNQPLTAVANSAHACQQALTKEDTQSVDRVKNLVLKISEQAQRAGEIIRHLRDFTRKSKPLRTSADVNELVLSVIELVESEASRHGVQIQHQFGQGLPQVVVDRIQIEQVLINLIVNAFDSLLGSEATRRKITVRTSCNEQGRVKVSVTDNGVGLTQAQITKIFEPFYTTKEQGMGMGLAISRTIVENHQGRISATSTPEQGTTFRFFLPKSS